MAETLTPPVASNADLDKARDEKCIPVARGMMEDMKDGLLPDVGENGIVDINPLVITFLKRGLEADLVIATEASYVFQLVLGALSGLNSAVQKVELPPLDEARYVGIGRKVLAYLAESNVRLGTVTPEESEADFAPVMAKINALFAEEKLSSLEVKYLMQNIFDMFSKVNNRFTESLEASSAKAEAKLFGIDSMNDLTLKQLDQVLISPVPEVKSAE